jgi:hypothetical protein
VNYATLVIGNGASVASRLTSNNAAIRPCKLIEVNCVNTSGSTAYLMYFDNVTAAPANGTTPAFYFPVQAGLGGTLGTSIDIMGGIFVWSTTATTLTAAGASGEIQITLKGGS